MASAAEVEGRRVALASRQGVRAGADAVRVEGAAVAGAAALVCRRALSDGRGSLPFPLPYGLRRLLRSRRWISMRSPAVADAASLPK